MVNLSFALSITGTCRLRFLAGKTERAECTGCWMPFVGAHVCKWHINCKHMDSIWKKLIISILHKKISKMKSSRCRDVSMHARIHWLTKYINKSHCYLCRDSCWIMWPCYGVHITVCMALLVCVLCQPVYSCIETSLLVDRLDFFLEIFLWRLVHVAVGYQLELNLLLLCGVHITVCMALLFM